MIRFLLGLPFSFRQTRLANSRPRIDKAEFVLRVVSQGGDRRGAEILWDALVSNWANKGFSPYPEDSLGRVFGIADEELDDDLISHTLNSLELPLPNREFTKRFGEIDTPLRIAQLVSECRQRPS